MTSLVDPTRIGESYTTRTTDAIRNNRHRHSKNALRSKHKSYKHICNKLLKKKLKKYKLRQDGKEDQDIIDVSATLVSSLFIRSPGKVKESAELELDELRPKNYLFRMVRKKQTTLMSKKNYNSPQIIKTTSEQNETSQISPLAEEKKQMNAFKLLMDSRNKSIGSNSPGKEQSIEEIDMYEVMEKKNTKAKRLLFLQKMAEEKGSLKKKELEELHENHIKKKMEKRAEKLKIMIMNKEPKTVPEKIHKNKISQKVRNPLDSIDADINGQVIDKPSPTLQLISIFGDTCDSNKSPEIKGIAKEDEEFLKKLSPSLRKKESMLSYFKKVDKDSESNPVDMENNSAVIKVKLGQKAKKKSKNKKLSLNRDTGSCQDLAHAGLHTDTKNDEVSEVQQIVILNTRTNSALSDKSGVLCMERKKRKREVKESSPSSDTPLSTYLTSAEDKRPKRTVKRPVKYNNNGNISSSDEELQIFTPKKKKHFKDNNSSKSKSAIDIANIETEQEISHEAKKPAVNKQKNSTKVKKPVNPSKLVTLAPIFKKLRPDLAEIEARQKFLQSGVPDQLKKQIMRHKENNVNINSFPQVVHVQQLPVTSQRLPTFNLSHEISKEEKFLTKSEGSISNMIDLSTLQSANIKLKNNVNIQTVLQRIKETHPRFPVHRTYKLLRGKKKGEFRANNTISVNLDNSVEVLNCSIDIQNDNPDQLTWCDKYKPLSGNEIIGNFENIKELKKWLVTWTENVTKSKANNLNASDSSDYYQSEPDSRDSMKSYNNLLILSGPVGCGKTSCVYAVAAELSMKVIEVNASSKRNGKIMLQDLQEATQSHKVNRATGSAENSQKVQEIVEAPPLIKPKKRGRPKIVVESKMLMAKHKLEGTSLSSSQESTRTVMSLILIDDADIIFDQDDGFYSAIVQLVQISKRPVILTTGSLSYPHLQRFLQSSKVLNMKPLLPNILGTWLDLMCLADSGTCCPGLGGQFLDFFRGDIRKTINCLQFYLGNQDELLNNKGSSQIDTQSNDAKFNADDESSCMSWPDCEIYDEQNTNDFGSDTHSVWRSIMNQNIYMQHMKSSLKIFDVWWNLLKILDIESNFKLEKQLNNVENPNKYKLSLEPVSTVLDSISVCDYFSSIRPECEGNVSSYPWCDAERNSVSELENFDYYDRKYKTNDEIMYELVKNSITSAQDKLGLEESLMLDFPGMSAKRKRDRIVSRHKKLTSYLSLQSSLDRKALALDYWSSCRTICRIERSKTDSNSKRNNRFCHYLKSLSVLCNSDSFDSLANSLNPSGH